MPAISATKADINKIARGSLVGMAGRTTHRPALGSYRGKLRTTPVNGQ
jgi:hypothetical protein